MKHAVMFLPGIIAPAAVRYRALIGELPDVRSVLHELAVYEGRTPPPGYSIAMEMRALDRAADEAGLERFHLFGHSGGGAICLAYAAAMGERLVSLAVDEPATDFTDEGDAVFGWAEFDRALSLPPDQAMPAFMRLQLAPDVPLPTRPDAPAPEWMAKRPAGVAAFVVAIRNHRVGLSEYSRFRRPVYFSSGSLAHPRWLSMQERLAKAFPDFTGDRFDGLHHFSPLHQVDPPRAAAILSAFWERSET